jgi:hypothetical protein
MSIGVHIGIEYIQVIGAELIDDPYAPDEPAEFTCINCQRGLCARCKDTACTCCYGGDCG